MKTTASLLFVSLVPMMIYGGESSSLLSPQKHNIINQKQSVIDNENEKLRTNWIAPINLSGSYSHDKSAIGDIHSETGVFSASLSQDIFRSGGITYQINYADAKKQSDSILLDQQIASLNSQVIYALLTYQKTLLQREQSDTRLANKEIEVFIKRQLYDAGKADITELNNALMEKSGEQKNHALLTYTLADYRYEISKISDINPDTFTTPRFSLIDKETYLASQWDLKSAYAQSESLENLYGVTKSNYLPKIALNADAGYREYTPRDSAGRYDGNFYSGGISMSIPLTYNASATIQEAKATSLEQIAATADKRRELEATYSQIAEKLNSYQAYIDIISKNISLYDELIGVTQAGLNAGTKTGYDLQTLQNSQKIEKLEIEINRLNIQIELAKLYFSTNKDL